MDRSHTQVPSQDCILDNFLLFLIIFMLKGKNLEGCVSFVFQKIAFEKLFF